MLTACSGRNLFQVGIIFLYLHTGRLSRLSCSTNLGPAKRASNIGFNFFRESEFFEGSRAARSLQWKEASSCRWFRLLEYDSSLSCSAWPIVGSKYCIAILHFRAKFSRSSFQLENAVALSNDDLLNHWAPLCLDDSPNCHHFFFEYFITWIYDIVNYKHFFRDHNNFVIPKK